MEKQNEVPEEPDAIDLEEMLHNKYGELLMKQKIWNHMGTWFRRFCDPDMRKKWRFGRLCFDIEIIRDAIEQLIVKYQNASKDKLEPEDSVKTLYENLESKESTTERRIRKFLRWDEPILENFKSSYQDYYQYIGDDEQELDNRARKKHIRSKKRLHYYAEDPDEEERDFISPYKAHRASFVFWRTDFRQTVLNYTHKDCWYQNEEIYIEGGTDRKYTPTVRKSRGTHRQRLSDLQKNDRKVYARSLPIEEKKFEDEDDYSPDPNTRRVLEENQRGQLERMKDNKVNGLTEGEFSVNIPNEQDIRRRRRKQERKDINLNDIKNMRELDLLRDAIVSPFRQKYFDYMKSTNTFISLEDYQLIQKELKRRLKSKSLKRKKYEIFWMKLGEDYAPRHYKIPEIALLDMKKELKNKINKGSNLAVSTERKMKNAKRSQRKEDADLDNLNKKFEYLNLSLLKQESKELHEPNEKENPANQQVKQKDLHPFWRITPRYSRLPDDYLDRFKQNRVVRSNELFNGPRTMKKINDISRVYRQLRKEKEDQRKTQEEDFIEIPKDLSVEENGEQAEENSNESDRYFTKPVIVKVIPEPPRPDDEDWTNVPVDQTTYDPDVWNG